MKNTWLISLNLGLFALVSLISNFVAAEDSGWVTVRPVEIDEILANPGMGWETFHHTAANDRNLPDWIPSTVQYLRWGWAELEPEPGRLNVELIDKVLSETRSAGQKLAFRVMCCSTTRGRPYHPRWLRDIGGRVIITRYRDVSGLEVPDLDDPVTLRAHLDFIRRLGAKYDGHPDLDHVDLGSVGWWGEWHMSNSEPARMPLPENQRRIIDTYLESFRKTPLLMLIDGPEMLHYATSRGTGWRADCLGDMGGFSRNWCHMRNAYPSTLSEARALDVWKTAPVAWETCWDIRKWVQEGWSLRYIFNYALALHGSYFNNKSAPLPPGDNVREEVTRFLRRLGYRLVIRELRHPAIVRSGENLPVTMVWQNVGSAPCYRPYRMAVRLTGPSGKRFIHVSDKTVRAILPGEVEVFTESFMKNPPDLPPGKPVTVEEIVPIAPTLEPGEYSLAVGVVDGADRQTPVVQLAIAGKDADGWYPLSRFRIASP